MKLKQMVNRVPDRYEFVKWSARRYFHPSYRALEVGANDGTFAIMFKELGYYTHAFDIKDFKLYGKVDRYTVDPKGFEWFVLPHEYELIHIGQVLEHVDNPEDILYNASRFSRGLVIVSVPNFMSRDHLRVYSKTEIIRLVSKFFWVAGCKVIKLPKIKTNFQKLQFIVVAHARPREVL